MSYTLRILTEASRDLVVEALRAEAGKRTRVAQGAALALAPDRAARRDVRAASVRVTDLLAEAGTLDQLAEELAAAVDVPLVEAARPAAGTIAILEADGTVVEVDPDGTERVTREADDDLVDDGLSPAAHAAMAQAEAYAATELRDDDGPDVDTNAIVEDDTPPVDEDTAARIAAADAAILEEGLTT